MAKAKDVKLHVSSEPSKHKPAVFRPLACRCNVAAEGKWKKSSSTLYASLLLANKSRAKDLSSADHLWPEIKQGS